MIRARIGVAVAIALALASLAIAVVAFTSTVRDDKPRPGRLVQTRITDRLTGGPVPFPLDDFMMSPDGAGHVAALYAYPPGFFGHARGCKVVWQSDAIIQAPDGTHGPGLFTDPCSGARFDRTGALISGSADRGLDRFAMTPEPDGFLVDTRTLLCGPEANARGATATPTPESPATCARASGNADAR